MTAIGVEDIVARARNAKRFNGYWMVSCPIHGGADGDRDPSLTVRVGDDGTPQLHCHACGDSVRQTELVQAFGLEPGEVWPRGDRDDDPDWRMPLGGGRWGDIVARYPYYDEHGTLLYEVCRSAAKDFRQRRPDPQRPGHWLWNLNGVKRLPYRLPQLLAAVAEGEPVTITEGEKDVEALVREGVIATCNSGGAGKWDATHAGWLAGATSVVIVADRDQAGADHAAKVRETLEAIGIPEIFTVQAKTGKDAHDHLAAGHGIDEFEPMPDTADASAPILGLGMRSLADWLADPDDDPGWLAEPMWPADAYGVIGAEKKAGKTWTALDLAVSVATGSTWLGQWPCPPGPVTMFLGEGGRRKMLRRLQAIAVHKGVDLTGLPIRFALRTPQLTDKVALELLRIELDDHPARLIIVDPFYLAAAGAETSNLARMGEVLGNVQRIAQDARAALTIVCHWNKTGDGSGSHRFTGVGLAEWGRVLMSISVASRRTDPETGEETALLRFEVTGDEIAETKTTFRRQIRSTDQHDLHAPMLYSVEPIDIDEAPSDTGDGLSPAQKRVRDIILDDPVRTWSVQTMGDALADGGLPLKARTIQKAFEMLVSLGIATKSGDQRPGTPGLWKGCA